MGKQEVRRFFLITYVVSVGKVELKDCCGGLAANVDVDLKKYNYFRIIFPQNKQIPVNKNIFLTVLSVVAAADERDVLPARGAHREDVLRISNLKYLSTTLFAQNNKIAKYLVAQPSLELVR